MLGRHVATVTAGDKQTAGPHTLAIPLLHPGFYTVRLLTGGVAAYSQLVVE